MTNHLYDGLFRPHEGRDTPFLIAADGSIVTHGAFLDDAARMAAALRDLGLVPGDRIAIQLSKGPAMLAAVAAAIRCGIVFLPLNTAYTPSELGYHVADAGAALFLADPGSEGRLGGAAAGAGARLMTLGPSGSGSFGALAARAVPGPDALARRGPDDLAALLYTSGTTGRSKGAMLTHGNLLSNAQVLAREWRFTAADVLLHALPVFHTHGLFVATNVALVTGCPMIFLPRFDADAVIGQLPQATAMMGVPTFYTRLLDHPGLTAALVRHMRLFVSGSAPLLAETHRAWESRTGHRILERYGMTETNMNTSNPYEGDRRPGTVGRALPGIEVRVCDPPGRPVAAGQPGVIEIRGPNVFSGYWRMPEKTKEELRADGFFLTGDIGVLDAEGYLTIVGRAKDLVITGGYNVYPREVELALDAQQDVLESAVIGVPHPDLGEAVVAVVVPRPGHSPDPARLIDAVAGRLAGYKRPKHLAVMAELPRNAMGKVQKAALRAAFADLFSRPRADR